MCFPKYQEWVGMSGCRGEALWKMRELHLLMGEIDLD